LEVQLLDSNGFKIKSFIVSGESFHPVPGSESLFEAAGEAFCATDDEYKNACDYLIRNTNRLF
jgi:hypothetical protein